jgi:hypothetical protein
MTEPRIDQTGQPLAIVGQGDNERHLTEDKHGHLELNMPEREHIIPRTGRPELTFTGRLVAQSVQKEGVSNRWHNIRVFKTHSGKYVAWIAYRTRWNGERCVSCAQACDTIAALVAFLADYYPGRWLIGFPDRPEYRVKQTALRTHLEEQYAQATAAIYDQMPECRDKVD